MTRMNNVWGIRTEVLNKSSDMLDDMVDDTADEAADDVIDDTAHDMESK